MKLISPIGSTFRTEEDTMVVRKAVIDINGTLEQDVSKTVAQVTDEVIKKMKADIRASSWKLTTSVAPGATDRSSPRYGMIQVGIEYDFDDPGQQALASKAEADLRAIAQRAISKINRRRGGLSSI